MELKTRKQLEEARSLFFSWRLAEAYTIFRRFFDRLPFRQEKAHAYYIGMFVRVLAELGKSNEMRFYLLELERLYEKTKSPFLSFQLAMIYTRIAEPRWEKARVLFESIVRAEEAVELHSKAKMMLAMYYCDREDIAAARLLIDSIAEDDDIHNNRLIEVWRAVILRREHRYQESKDRMEKLLQSFDSGEDWYAYFSAQMELTKTLVALKSYDAARSVIEDLKVVFAKKNLKSIQMQINSLEALLKGKEGFGTLRFEYGENENVITYDEKQIVLRRESNAAKLLTLLVKQRFLKKGQIARNLYHRFYDQKRDDKQIYYQIQSLRKRLKVLGLPPEAISVENNGYRLVPEVEWIREEL